MPVSILAQACLSHVLTNTGSQLIHARLFLWKSMVSDMEYIQKAAKVFDAPTLLVESNVADEKMLSHDEFFATLFVDFFTSGCETRGLGCVVGGVDICSCFDTIEHGVVRAAYTRRGIPRQICEACAEGIE